MAGEVPQLRAVPGGKAARRPTAREVLEQMTEAPARDLGVKGLDRWEQQRGRPLSVYEAMMATLVDQALTGDLKAVQFVRDTLGDKPGTEPEAAPGMSEAERALVQKLARRLEVTDPCRGPERRE